MSPFFQFDLNYRIALSGFICLVISTLFNATSLVVVYRRRIAASYTDKKNESRLAAVGLFLFVVQLFTGVANVSASINQ
jgi:hypothetical protein